MKVKYFIIALTLVFNSTIFAQLSEGGIPPSFKYEEQISLRRNIASKSIVPLRNIQELKNEDEQIPKIGYPQRIGTSIPIDIDLYKDGVETQLSNGERIVRYTINAPDAIGIMLYYSEFYIPEGGRLFIYSQDKEQLLGAYTHNTNPKTQKYATEAIYADGLTLEYVLSTASTEIPRIKIEDATYIYSDNVSLSLRGQSLPCMIDINCAEGANWQTQKKGVVKITMKFSDGTYVCSGSLVNNTKQDKAPYILTAYHCFFTDKEVSDPALSTYTFNYEREVCGIITNNKGNEPLVGATLKAISPINKGSDGTLLRINSDIPDTYKAYYNGWDVSGTIPQSGVIIHHPNGDYKKITTYTEKPNIVGNIGFDGTAGRTASNSAWEVIYSSSVTEGGSSGSPIFNQNGLIIGTLSGGSSTCEAPTSADYYGRLFSHWDKYDTSNGNSKYKYHFKEFLDPENTGKITLEGLNYDAMSIEYPEIETQESLIAFPSPATDELNLNCSEIIREVSIIDITGKQVLSVKNYDSSTITIPVTSWSNGVYNVTVKTNEGIFITQKIIKQ